MTKRVILASGSPQRQELLKQMGVIFEAVTSNFDEQLDDGRDVFLVAQELALGKAQAVAALHPEAYVIGSDTVVVFEGKQLGKQPDEASARALLRRLSGQKAEVVTAVALVGRAQGIIEVRADTATITLQHYGNSVVEKYLRSGDWRNKAAAIAIQSESSPPVASVNGSYDTILGLATAPLADMLQQHGIPAESARHTHGRAERYSAKRNATQGKVM